MQETQEVQVWSLGQEDPMEEEMAIHSSIPAKMIPWTDEAGRLQSMGEQRVRHSTHAPNSLHLLIPNSQSILTHLPLPLATTSLFSMSVSLKT